MKTRIFVIFAIIFLATGLSVSVNKALSQESNGLANIQYPIEKLGNCKNESDCKIYCDEPKNTEACFTFAEKNNLMSREEIGVAKKFLSGNIKGPGGCKTKDACEEYCNDTSRIDECISFAEENNLIPPEELAEAKKVQSAIARGAKPPPCGNKKSCDVYCDDSEHMEECITFGIEAGFIQGKELEDVKKMLAAVKRGVKPPPCKGKEACDEYCSSPDNMEVCMNFAMEAGFMSEQEKADSQKMLQAIKKGVKPPNCRGKEECDVYCSTEEHFEECANFAEAAGFMSSEDAAMARKTKGKGPGGCKGKEECDAFCNNPDNQETCFNFAKDNGMIPEEDLKRMEKGKQQMKQSFEQMPAEVEECLNSAVGADMVEKMKNGVMPSREISDKMGGCFQKMGPPREPGEPGQGGMIPPAGQIGPGGCKTEEECQKFQSGPGATNPGGQIMPQQAGPGGCKGPEECKVYCESNPQDCQNFQQGSGPDFQQGSSSGQQCQGENCQYAPPQGQIPTAEQQMQNFQTQPVEQQLQQSAPAPSENPPPPPTSFLINPDSLVASAVRALINFLLYR